MNWWKNLKGKIKRREALSNHTSFGIGGRADFFIEPEDSEDLRLLLKLAGKNKLKLLFIGSGSNILAKDTDIKKIVVHLNSGNFTKVKFENNYCEAGSGVTLLQLIRQVSSRGLGGLEFLAGIPGTVGGAVIMNAGAWGKEIADSLVDISVMDYNGNVRVLVRNKIKFAYRSSGLDKYIILGVRFKLNKATPDQIKNRIDKYLKDRRKNQGFAFPNAGCIFKNSRNNTAGKLIDLCGLKGSKAGGAVISEKHANFILNINKAKASDVLKLMKLVKIKVKRNFKINLEPEIKIWD